MIDANLKNTIDNKEVIDYYALPHIILYLLNMKLENMIYFYDQYLDEELLFVKKDNYIVDKDTFNNYLIENYNDVFEIKTKFVINK
jgi:hypothetical protein